MKKLLYIFPMILCGMMTYSSVMNFNGAFVLNTMYHITPLIGTNQSLAPVVTSHGVTCVLVQESLESSTQYPESYANAWNCTI